ncbi:hypothetical protein S140_52 [Shewanella sp. phage 1/40]|uniref:hypothetical protein n=1 Tax=Shewanella sp. phage 1/40 TaxID=1458860 RepID=UPI0004F5A75D|nr:hypothetical protein S140_52 [Shewanella sp. phage 1/40]AHK11462.1 hypothetical protein S140_52 [Shewanella sp. phage 1/40]
MKTVKEFKDLGVEFVVGDIVDDSFSNDGSDLKPLSARTVASCNIGRYNFDDAQVGGFAWRPLNTLPDNPKFKYEQDDDKGLWRPLLDQSANPVNDAAVKPSDDKQSQDREIEIGNEVAVNTANGIKNGTVIGVFSLWYWVDVKGVGLETYDKFLVSHLDTRTPKQKAVDELAKSIELSTDGSYGEIAEYLISIGYEKKC